MNQNGTFAATVDQATLDRHPPMRVFLEQIRVTPLTALTDSASSGRILAKCEWKIKPSGTSKHRAAIAVLYRLLLRATPLAGWPYPIQQ